MLEVAPVSPAIVAPALPLESAVISSPEHKQYIIACHRLLDINIIFFKVTGSIRKGHDANINIGFHQHPLVWGVLSQAGEEVKVEPVHQKQNTVSNTCSTTKWCEVGKKRERLEQTMSTPSAGTAGFELTVGSNEKEGQGRNVAPAS